MPPLFFFPDRSSSRVIGRFEIRWDRSFYLVPWLGSCCLGPVHSPALEKMLRSRSKNIVCMSFCLLLRVEILYSRWLFGATYGK